MPLTADEIDALDVGGAAPAPSQRTLTADEINSIEPAPQIGAGRQAFSRFARAALGGVAGTLEAIPIAATALASKFGDPLLSEADERDVTSRPLYRAGRAIRRVAEEAYPVDPNRPKSFLVDTLPQAAGSMAAFMTGGAAGKVAGASTWATVGALGAGVGGAEAFDEAKKAGANDEDAFKVFAINAGLGTTEAIPIAGWLNRLNKASGNKLKQAIIEGSEEAAQEVFQQVGGNLTAQKYYDPDRKIFEGAGEGGAAGFTLGSVMSLVVSGIGGRRARVAQPSPPDDRGLSRFAPVKEESAAPALDTQLILERLAKSAGGASIDEGKTFALSADYTWEGLARDLGTGTRTAALLADAGIVERTPGGNYRLNHDLFSDDIESLRKRGFLPVLTPPNVTEDPNVTDRESSSMEVSTGQSAKSVPPDAGGTSGEVQKPAAVLAQAQPIEPEVARQKLWVNMQGREMDIPLDQWQQPASPHLKLVLGDNAPSWRDLNFSGVVTANKNPDGSYRVKVIPRTTEQQAVATETGIADELNQLQAIPKPTLEQQARIAEITAQDQGKAQREAWEAQMKADLEARKAASANAPKPPELMTRKKLGISDNWKEGRAIVGEAINKKAPAINSDLAVGPLYDEKTGWLSPVLTEATPETKPAAPVETPVVKESLTTEPAAPVATPTPATPVKPATRITSEDSAKVESVRAAENKGRIAIVMNDGTAYVGELAHALLFNKVLELGLAKENDLISGSSGYVRPDGIAWDGQGKPLNVTRIVTTKQKSPASDVSPKQSTVDAALALARQRKVEGKSQLSVARELSESGLSDSDATGIAAQVFQSDKPTVAATPAETADLFPDLKGKAPTLERVRNAIVEAEADLEAKFQAATDENIRSDNPIHAEVDLAQNRVDKLRALGQRLERAAISKAEREPKPAASPVAPVEERSREELIRKERADAIAALEEQLKRKGEAFTSLGELADELGIIQPEEGESGVPTKVGDVHDMVLSRPGLNFAVREDSVANAQNALAEAGLIAERGDDGLFRLSDEFTQQEVEGQRLVTILEREIQSARADDRHERIANLLNTVVVHLARDRNQAFSQALKDKLYTLAQGERSSFGRALGGLAMWGKVLANVAMNPDLHLSRLHSKFMGGEQISPVMEKLMKAFRDFFSPEEIKTALDPLNIPATVQRLIQLNQREEGGRVYRQVQSRLKAKVPKTQEQKDRKAREDEAVEAIIRQAETLGVKEPKALPNQKLTPDQRLALMTTEKTQAKIQKAIEQAIKDAEFNAGWKAEENAAKTDEDKADVAERKAVGEEPSEEMIQAGLQLKEYRHWQSLRDNLLNYSPTTVKLVEDVITGRFKGAQFKPKVAKLEDLRIDFKKLAISPEAEVQRVFDAQLVEVADLMQAATPETVERVSHLFRDKINEQLQQKRHSVLDLYFNPATRTVSTPAGKLGELLNAGLASDSRARDPKIQNLIRLIAAKYASADDMDAIARKSRAEKFAFVDNAVRQALTDATLSLPSEFGQFARQVAFNEIATRLFNAEERIARAVVDSKDVTFGAKPPATPSELAAKRAEQIQALNEAVNAGTADVVTMDSLARKALLNRLTPKLAELAKALDKLPPDAQAEKAKLFADTVLAELTLDPAITDKVRGTLESAFTRKMEAAKQAVVAKMFKERVTRTETPGELDEIKRQINSGLLEDKRLNDPALFDRVAEKSTIRNLLPNVTELVNRILESPRYKLSDIKADIAAALVKQLGLTGEQANNLSELIYGSLDGTDTKPGPLRTAARKALEKVQTSLSDSDRKVFFKAGTRFTKDARGFKKGKTLWEKIEGGVRAGLFDPGTVLEGLAREQGWAVPTPAEKAQIKTWAEEEMRLRTPTQRQIDAEAGTESEKLAKATKKAEVGTESERLALIKKIQAKWSLWSMPTSWKPWNWGNDKIREGNAKAVNEFVGANLLWKAGFAVRQWIDVGLVSMPLNAANRTLVHALERAENDGVFSVAAVKDLDHATREMVIARLASLKATYRQMERTVTGHTNRRVLDRMTSSIGIFERMAAKADDLEARGNMAGARAVRVATVLQAGYRIAATWDSIQSVGLEWQEMRQQLATELRKAGKPQVGIDRQLDDIFGGLKIDMVQALEEARLIGLERGLTKDKATLQQDAWNLIKAKAYDRMRAAANTTTDYAAENEQYRELHSWNLPETGGIGGLLAETIKGIKSKTEKSGIPTGGLLSFGNAMGIATNRIATFSGGGLFGGFGFEDSPWYQGPRNIRQRRIEAVQGLAAIGILVGLAAAGKILVQIKYPEDKDEKEKFIAEGHKLNTVRFVQDDGKWVEYPIQMSPFSFIASPLYMIGGVQALLAKQQREQARLDEQARRTGTVAGKAKPVDARDVLGVVAQGAYGLLTGGRTASGAVQSFSDYGDFNLNKSLSRLASPYLPGIPAWQEAARVMGAAVDTRTATMLELLTPSPWSGHQRVNSVGDPMVNPNDAIRALQVMTGGIGFGSDKDLKDNHVYQQLAAAGFATPDAGRSKGYNFDGTIRQMTPQELERYTVARGKAFKQELQGVDVTGLAPKEAKTIVQGAFQRANAAALESVGATAPRAASTSSGSSSALPTAPATGLSRRSGVPGGSIAGPRRTGLARLAASRVGRRSRIARPRFASLRGLGRPTRRRRSIVGRLGRVSRPRGLRRPRMPRPRRLRRRLTLV